jgi:hypothetical protein
MKKHILLSILVVSSQAYAAKLTIQTTSAKPICVYVDDVNELCVTTNTKKSIDVTPQEGHRIQAIDHTGLITSEFLTLRIPQNVNAVILDVNTKGSKMSVTPSIANVLTKEK